MPTAYFQQHRFDYACLNINCLEQNLTFAFFKI